MDDLTVRQQEIVVKALEIISTQGVQQFTIKNISEAIGVSDAALYKHFKSKDDIIMYLLILFEQTFLNIDEFVFHPDLSAMEKLESIFEEKFRRVSESPEQVVVMDMVDLFRGNDAFRAEFITLIDRYKDNFMRVIIQGQEEQTIATDADPEYLYFMLIGSIHFLMKKWDRSQQQFDLMKEGKHLWQTVQQTITQ